MTIILSITHLFVGHGATEPQFAKKDLWRSWPKNILPRSWLMSVKSQIWAYFQQCATLMKERKIIPLLLSPSLFPWTMGQKCVTNPEFEQDDKQSLKSYFTFGNPFQQLASLVPFSSYKAIFWPPVPYFKSIYSREGRLSLVCCMAKANHLSWTHIKAFLRRNLKPFKMQNGTKRNNLDLKITKRSLHFFT